MRANICLVFLTHTTSLQHSNILVPLNVSTVIVSVWFHIFVTRIMKFMYKKGCFSTSQFCFCCNYSGLHLRQQ